MNYQREGAQVPFVTQQQSWPDGSGFASHSHPNQAIHFTTHGPTLQHDAWAGYRPTSQGQLMHMVPSHNPFCHQHGKLEPEPAMSGHACGCQQHQNNNTAPPTVPTPPPSDGSPHPGWTMPMIEANTDHMSKRVKIDWNFDNNTPVLRPDGVRKKNAVSSNVLCLTTCDADHAY